MKTLVNFRDLGNMTTQEGLKVKENHLLRSGEVVNLSDEDIQTLVDTYRVTQIIDFRSEGEVTEKPIDKIPGTEYLNIDVMKDVAQSVAMQEEMMKNLQPGLVDDHMKEVNQQFVTLESARKGYEQFLKACLNNEEGATLFHCFAGKDRTGFGAAILLKTLGVREEDIMSDYLKTVEQRKEANEVFIQQSRQKGLPEDKLEALRTIMSVKKEYLTEAFLTIEKEYENFENYIKTGLNMTEADIANLKQKYLA